MADHLPRIVIDLEKLRHINCGLGGFRCTLARNCSRVAPGRFEPVFFLPSGAERHFPGWRVRADPRRALEEGGPAAALPGRWRRPFCPSPRLRSWHVTNQMSKYLPLDPRVPVVLTIHDLNFLHEAPHDEQVGKISRKLADIQVKIDRAAAVVTDSQFVADDVASQLAARRPADPRRAAGPLAAPGRGGRPAGLAAARAVSAHGRQLPGPQELPCPARSDRAAARPAAGDRRQEGDALRRVPGPRGLPPAARGPGDPARRGERCRPAVALRALRGLPLSVADRGLRLSGPRGDAGRPAGVHGPDHLPAGDRRRPRLLPRLLRPGPWPPTFAAGMEAFAADPEFGPRARAHAATYSWGATARGYARVYESTARAKCPAEVAFRRWPAAASLPRSPTAAARTDRSAPAPSPYIATCQQGGSMSKACI